MNVFSSPCIMFEQTGGLLNGESLGKPWFYHTDFIRGGTLELQLGPEPDKAWGSGPEDAPPSETLAH